SLRRRLRYYTVLYPVNKPALPVSGMADVNRLLSFRIDLHIGLGLHASMIDAPPNHAAPTQVPWWRLLNRYHWTVFALAAFGWLFDCFDQQIFVWSRSITMHDLMRQADDATQFMRGNWATSLFILGWATGGII